MSGLFAELRRRNVFKVSTAYILLAWIIAQVADTLISMLQLPDVVAKSVVVILLLCFPLAVFFAWAYELTPEGIKKEKEVDREQSITHVTGRKLDFLIIGALAAAVAYFAFFEDRAKEETVSESAAAHEHKSIAVLPFVNMSDDLSNEYFSDGISEEILNSLVKTGGMRVISRTSSFAFKNIDVDIPTIAEQLNVDHILEGSVRKSGDQLRITAQLIDVETDSHLWSETYDRTIEDIFSIQSEISSNIVAALQLRLGTAQSDLAVKTTPPTENLEAYQAYLQARYLLHDRGNLGAQGLRRSQHLFEEATRLDPEFAGAWSGLAAVHMLLPAYSGKGIDDSVPLVESAVAKALSLDSSNSEAHAVLGMLRIEQNRWVEGDASLREAIRVDPDYAMAYIWYGTTLTRAGKTQKALDVLLLAADKDPVSAIGAHWLADIYRHKGDYENSRIQAQRSLDLGLHSSVMGVYTFHLARGHHDAAARALRESPAFGEDRSYVEPLIAAVRDPAKIAEFRSVVDDILSRNQSFYYGWMYFDFDDPEAVLDVIEEYKALGNASGVLYRVWDPGLTELRNHPRFTQVAEQIGLMDYWRATGWPDLCQQSTDDLVCD